MKTEYTLKHRFGGQNEMSWIQPICSCGWVGEKHYAWNDHQRTNLRNEEVGHLRASAAKTIKARLALAKGNF